MAQLIRLLRTDIIKTRRTPFLLIHLLIPIIGAGMFIAYYSFSRTNPVEKVSGYFQVLSITFPTLIGIVCSMVAEQESSAGSFQVMLITSRQKVLVLLSKLLLLLLFGMGSTFIAAGAFYLGFVGILEQDMLGFKFYLASSGILLSSNIFLYVLHLHVSLNFSKGPSIGLGILESLIAALLLTGLGEGIWLFTHCGWSGHFMAIWAYYSSGFNVMPAVSNELLMGITICSSLTILSLLLACVWFSRWEGRKLQD